MTYNGFRLLFSLAPNAAVLAVDCKWYVSQSRTKQFAHLSGKRLKALGAALFQGGQAGILCNFRIRARKISLRKFVTQGSFHEPLQSSFRILIAILIPRSKRFWIRLSLNAGVVQCRSKRLFIRQKPGFDHLDCHANGTGLVGIAQFVAALVQLLNTILVPLAIAIHYGDYGIGLATFPESRQGCKFPGITVLRGSNSTGAFGKHAELPDFPRAELHRGALCCLGCQFSNEDGQWPFQLKCSILLDASQVTRPLAQNENSHVAGFP